MTFQSNNRSCQPPMANAGQPRRRQTGRALRLVLWSFAVVLLTLAVAWAVGPRNTFGPDQPANRPAPPADLAQLDGWLAKGEAAYTDIRPGTAKGVVWHGAAGARTPWSVVYLHGYSASRLETAPLAEQIAAQLGANLFHTRLTGHGRTAQAMGEASVQDWLADTVEAVNIGRQLGERVLVIGVSTGATLATWLATHPQGQGVAAYVFVSPNFGPKDKRSELINQPWGQQLVLALEGETRGKVYADPRDQQAWTGRQATRALFPMMALVKQMREADLSRFNTPLLVLYSQRDQVVDPLLTQQVVARIPSANKVLEDITYSESRDQHVLAGDIRAPAATGPMARHVVQWVRGIQR